MEATNSRVSLSIISAAFAGRLSIERELGRGGMATVFLARDLAEGHRVAVKVLHPELVATIGTQRFLREIEIGKALQHHRIVGVLESGEVQGLPYYSMPFVDGPSLRERLTGETQLAIDETIRIASQISEALAFAHARGVVHRDIKPENILLGPDGAMLADFGIARAVEVSGGETLTRTGTSIGTPAYMSPEQAAGGRDVTPQSDIYSLACVVYEMLAGQPPFSGPTAMALLARHSLDPVPRLKTVRDTVPDAVEDAVIRAMAKVPADRFRSVAEFAALLIDDEGARQRRKAAVNPERGTDRARPAVSWARLRTPLAVLAAAALVSLVAWLGSRATHVSVPPPGIAGDFAKQNIAVLYFADRSERQDLSYLADGLTEALIDELSTVPQLRVASRNGSAAFRGSAGIASDSIARALKVGTIVRGSVERTGDRVRVTVALDDAMTGRQIDAAKLEETLRDPLALQDSVAARISEFLRKRVGQEIQEITSRTGTDNPAAWEAFTRARQIVAEVDLLAAAGDVSAAKRRAATADSALGAAELLDRRWLKPITERGWLAYAVGLRLIRSGPEFAAVIDSGLADASRAVALSPEDADAIELRGTLHYLQWLTNLAPDAAAANALLASAEGDLSRAANTSTQPARAWNLLSHLRLNKGELAEAKLAAENAYGSDPYLKNVEATLLRLFLASLDLQLRGEAEKWCTQLGTRFPTNYRAIECRLWLYALPAERRPPMAEVWRTYDAYVNASPANLREFDRFKGRMMVGIAFLRAGFTDSARAIASSSIADPQLDPQRETVNLAAIIYAQSGDSERAIRLLAQWYAANPQQRVTGLRDQSWWLNGLRSDPKYQALLKGVE